MQLPYERGVFPRSELFESTPTRRAEQVLFYLQRAGHFFCDTHYTVSRESLSSFLLAVVLDGSLEICSGGTRVIARAGNVALIDCYQPHAYRALEPLEYLWIHFDGGNTRAFYRTLTQPAGGVFCASVSNRIPAHMQQILQQLRSVGQIEEVAASRRLHDLLCDLLYTENEQETENPLIASAQRYIREHLGEAITVTDLAKHCCLSPSHFTRLFRSFTGQSPHEYWTNLRINRAKQLLKETELSIAEIAEAVGYDYDTSFTAAFRNKVGLSPRRFRNMPI